MSLYWSPTCRENVYRQSIGLENAAQFSEHDPEVCDVLENLRTDCYVDRAILVREAVIVKSNVCKPFRQPCRRWRTVVPEGLWFSPVREHVDPHGVVTSLRKEPNGRAISASKVEHTRAASYRPINPFDNAPNELEVAFNPRELGIGDWWAIFAAFCLGIHLPSRVSSVWSQPTD